MQPKHLDWLDHKSRKAILQHPDITGYSPTQEKKEIFVPCFKIQQVQGPRCTRKEYLGYGLQTAPVGLLHPILAIFVRLQLTDLQLLYRLKAVLQFYSHHPIQSLQKIYDVKRLSFAELSFEALQINCELYKMTLHDLFTAINQKRIPKFSVTFLKYLRYFLLQAYLSILDLLDQPESAELSFTFSIEPKDIMLDQFYRLMLGNPLFVQGHLPLLAFQNDKEERFIHGDILSKFLKIFSLATDLVKDKPTQLEKITQHAFSRKAKFLRVKEEIQLIENLVQRIQISFEFPNQQLLEYFHNAEERLAMGADAIPLVRFHQEQSYRCKEVLRARAEQYAQHHQP